MRKNVKDKEWRNAKEIMNKQWMEKGGKSREFFAFDCIFSKKTHQHFI